MRDEVVGHSHHNPLYASSSAMETRFFDELISKRGEFDPFAPRGWKTLARCFAKLVQPQKRLVMLDVGCGTGQSRQIYAGTFQRYIGIDLSENALAVARRQFPHDQFIRADACTLPVIEESVDLIAFSSVLHHIPQFERALAEAYRVLTPGGVVFAFDPNLLHPAMALFRWPRSPFYISAGVSPNECPLTPRELRNAFQAAGFVDIRQRAQSDIPYRRVAPRLINALLKFYNWADWIYEKIGLGRWFGTFVVTVGSKPVNQ